MTPVQKESLIEEAKKALKNPYPKDADTIYAAAVLTKKGNIYSAAQYFSDTYSLTLHSEQCALSHAAAHGEGEITAICITSNEKLEKGQFTYPCHMCKQLLYESSRRSKIKMEILLVNSFGEEENLTIDDMISHAWPR
ncbi:MAG: cytidine deaminase [Candidatus Levybacteria bacterium]|nr:cytidine deaminase [Candidatus Levybacteria bacterium]